MGVLLDSSIRFSMFLFCHLDKMVSRSCATTKSSGVPSRNKKNKTDVKKYITIRNTTSGKKLQVALKVACARALHYRSSTTTCCILWNASAKKWVSGGGGKEPSPYWIMFIHNIIKNLVRLSLVSTYREAFACRIVAQLIGHRNTFY